MKCELTYQDDYPPLYNHPAVMEQVVSSIEQAVDPDIQEVKAYPAFSGSEDYAYYLEKIPGVFFNNGCKPENVEQAYFNHHPKFDIDEAALLISTKAVGYVASEYIF